MKKYQFLYLIFYSPIFLFDYFVSLIWDKRRTFPSTYRYLRLLYVLSKGYSKKILTKPFEIVYMFPRSNSNVTKELNEFGYSHIQATSESQKLVKEIKNNLLQYSLPIRPQDC